MILNANDRADIMAQLIGLDPTNAALIIQGPDGRVLLVAVPRAALTRIRDIVMDTTGPSMGGLEPEATEKRVPALDRIPK